MGTYQVSLYVYNYYVNNWYQRRNYPDAQTSKIFKCFNENQIKNKKVCIFYKPFGTKILITR